MKNNKSLFILLIIAILLVFVPIMVFIFFFQEQEISSEISDWAYFGGFFGGTVGVMISLMNLAILAYLTMWVSKQGNEENKKLYFYNEKWKRTKSS